MFFFRLGVGGFANSALNLYFIKMIWFQNNLEKILHTKWNIVLNVFSNNIYRIRKIHKLNVNIVWCKDNTTHTHTNKHTKSMFLIEWVCVCVRVSACGCGSEEHCSFAFSSCFLVVEIANNAFGIILFCWYYRILFILAMLLCVRPPHSVSFLFVGVFECVSSQ